MESDRPANQPEQDDKKDKKKSKDKVVDWLPVFRGDERETPPENDSRVRGILRSVSERLFPKVEEVKPGKVESSAEPSEPNRDYTTGVESRPIIETEVQTDTTETPPEYRGIDFPMPVAETTTADRPDDTTAEVTPDITEPVEIEPEYQDEPIEPAPEHPGQTEQDPSIDFVLPLAEQENYRRQMESTLSNEQSRDNFGGTVYERASTIAGAAPTVERIIETNRGAAIGLGSALIVDQLSRSRDRKQERKINKLKRSDKELVEEVKFDKASIERIEKQNAVNRERIINQAEVQRVQTSNSERQDRIIEKAPAPRAETIFQNEQRRDRLTTVEKLVPVAEVLRNRPEVVRKKVEAAAEQNIPIESYFERRHEVKDNQLGGGGAGASGNAAMVGTVLHNRSQHDDQLASAMQQSDHSIHPMQNGTYRKAMATGATGAGAILTILGLMLLLG